MTTDTAPLYGELIEPATLKIERLLPGPIERVWAFLTESELRRQWLAAGEMQPKAGTAFTFTWRNDELTETPGERPEGFPATHSMHSRIVEFDPPRKLVFEWNNSGNVSFELEPKGTKVLLTVIHRRLPDRATLLKVAAGWHAHLDVLVLRAEGKTPTDFWTGWQRLHKAYGERIPA